MPNTDLLLAFFVATAVFAYMPGPSTIYAATQTIVRGRRGGLLAAAGIHIGGYVHVVAAASGLAALFAIVPVLYTVLKFIGAAYLVWLGLRYFFGWMALNAPETREAQIDDTRAFWESSLVEVLNPKTAIFYVAFLPQFTDPSAALPIWSQLLVLGTLVNMMFSSGDLLCVVFAERVRVFVSGSAKSNRLVNRIGGGVLVGLGLNLAVSQ